MSFKLLQKDGIKYLVIPAFEETGLVRHGFSTRSLDLGLKNTKTRESIIENHKIFCNLLGIDIKNVVCADQVHKDVIYEASKKDRGKGILKKSDIIAVDALITAERQVALMTYHADCVPLFFLDINKPAIGVAHAGWRGTVKKIGIKTVQKMIEKYGSFPKDILVGIGPCIKKCCYEVDSPVIEKLKLAFPYWNELVKYKGNNYWMLDLVLANKLQLESIGIKSKNIFISNFCTSCHNDMFFSYRADRKKSGSLATIIELV